jgi:stage III sporulation protein AE
METMQKYILLLLLLLFFRPSVGYAQPSEPVEEVVRSGLNHLQTGEVETFWQDLQKEYGKYFKEAGTNGIFETLLTNPEQFETQDLFSAFARFFFHEVLYNGKLLGSILMLTVLCMILQTLQNAFEQNQVSKVAYAIVFMVLLVLAMDSFTVAITSAKDAIGHMIDFMLALMPLMLTLLATMGNLASVSLFHPLIVFMIHVVGTLIYTVVFPLLFISTLLFIVSSMSDKYKVDQLASLLRKVSITVLGGLLTIFLSVISVQGATTAVADGVTIRTAKYITGNFVPVIGRTISDAADTVVGASLLVKNLVGVAGVIILLMICAFPAIKILSLSFIYNFSAAVMQPLGNSPIVECLSIIGKTFVYVFAALAAVGLMFYLALTIIMASGNISMMMR